MLTEPLSASHPMTTLHLVTNDQEPPGFARRNLLRGAAVGLMTAAIPVSALQSAMASTTSTDPTTSADPTTSVPRTLSARPGSGAPRCITNTMDDDRAWAAFLGRQDLVWQNIPTSWDEGPFLGNGRQATLLYRDDSAGSTAGSPGRLRLEVCHSEVQDHRPEYWPTFGLARLPVGYFDLITAGTVTDVDWRLSLWDSTLSGTITTTAGSIGLRLLIHDRRGVMIAELSPSAGERAATWEFHALRAVADRANPAWKKPLPPGYLDHPNPEAVLTSDGDIELCVQEMLAGGQTVTAWRQTSRAGTSTLYCATAHSYPESTAQDIATRQIRQAASASRSVLAAEHEQAWHAFYRKSFLSIPDARLESFYWIQLYKINAGTRYDAPIMATTGPWYIATRWPCVWWDMNAQVEYLLIHGSNHLELDALTGTFRDNQANLIAQVGSAYRADSAGLVRTTDRFLDGGLTPVPIPGDTSAPAGSEQEIGDLLWATFCVWLSWRHSMDRHRLADTVYPVLRRAVNYYLHFLTPGSDGDYHLPATYYPEHMFIADCSYDLELLRWGLGALLDAISRLGVSDARVGEYREALARLAPQTSDSTTGLNIAPDFPLPGSQAGYNYLLAIWPLYTLTWDQPEHRELIRTSLEYFWKDRSNWLGFTYAGAASQAALMGMGDQALEFLHEQWSSKVPVTANTMYAESLAPVIESPLGAARGLQDMLCQSWGGVIRVFPAVPTTWPDVTLHDFLTEGAFHLSAVRTDGTTRWIRLLSLAGEPLLLRAGIAGPLDVTALHTGRPIAWDQVDDETIRIHARAGDEVLIRPAGSTDALVIAPVAPSAPAPSWGLPT